MRILLAFAAAATLACSQGTHAVSEPAPSADQTNPQASSARVGAPAGAPAGRPGRQPVEVEMSNVNLRVTDDVTLQIDHLRGRFIPIGRVDAPYLDDKHSYAVTVDSGRVAVDMQSLTALMRRTLKQGDANVENVEISTDDQQRLRQKGTLDKGIKVPFDVRGDVGVTADGRIRMHADSVRGLGIPVRPLLKAFGIHMDDMLKIKPGHGVTIKDDDLILDPGELIPAPTIRGKITAVRLADGTLVQTFGSGERRRLSPPATSQNHIYWRGGELQFGKLTMVETDLELIDTDPRDAFDFSVDHWNDQLVAGYSKNTQARGLKTYLPDYDDLTRKPSGRR
jgi:hypothetical protein